jgi:CheY-like chemotaxis protein
MARILLIEDDPDIRDLMVNFLSMEGHAVLTAADAEDTVRLLQHDAAPDLVLMDLSLPGAVDGFALTRRLRDRPGFEAIPIIALTAHAMTEHRNRALAAGCDQHWTKPIVDLGRFADSIAGVLEAGRSRSDSSPA